MRVTWIGWALLAVTPMPFTLGRTRLYLLMVFFIPFSATAVANFGAGSSGSGLQVYMFLGTLWIFIETVRMLWRGDLKIPRTTLLPITLALAFGCIAIASLAMPLIIDGSVAIVSPELGSYDATPLYFRSEHITQALYLLFGLILTVLIAATNVDARMHLRTLRACTVA